MDIKTLQDAYHEFHTRDAELVRRQNAAQTDAQRFELERMRRALLVKLDSKIQGEFTRDLIGQAERELAGQQRAA
jgi:hypothetical protein